MGANKSDNIKVHFFSSIFLTVILGIGRNSTYSNQTNFKLSSCSAPERNEMT